MTLPPAISNIYQNHIQQILDSIILPLKAKL